VPNEHAENAGTRKRRHPEEPPALDPLENTIRKERPFAGPLASETFDPMLAPAVFSAKAHRKRTTQFLPVCVLGSGPVRGSAAESVRAPHWLLRFRMNEVENVLSHARQPGSVLVEAQLAWLDKARRRKRRCLFMLTVDDVLKVPLFSSLATTELRLLVRTSADMHLGAGEIVVPEGGERALFAVLAGKIEVFKTIDGIERKLGLRLPGSIFGEVPLALGTTFPGGYRALEPSRVLRADTPQYYTIAAASPELAEKIGALARERMGGLQGIAAEPLKARVTIVGQRWDGACGDLRRFLARNQISFEWLTPDAPQLSSLWPGALPAEKDYPAMRLADGTVAMRPAPRELARLLGLQTSPRAAEYDTMIIGGGSAGLAAAVYGASEGLRTIVIEREAPGGQAGTSSRIENYLGFPNGVSGDELASRALQQARRLGA
jgi:hypothetical protein